MPKEIIEIKGVKMEVDTREARLVDTLRIGDTVKVLTKDYSSFKTYPGIVVGFNVFKQRPSIEVAYVKTSYSDFELVFATINQDSEDIEIVKSCDELWIPFTHSEIDMQFEKKINKFKAEVADLELKRAFILNNFNKYFGQIAIEGE